MLTLLIVLTVAACLMLLALAVATMRHPRKPAPRPAQHRQSREPYRPRRLYGVDNPDDDTDKPDDV